MWYLANLQIEGMPCAMPIPENIINSRSGSGSFHPCRTKREIKARLCRGRASSPASERSERSYAIGVHLTALKGRPLQIRHRARFCPCRSTKKQLRPAFLPLCPSHETASRLLHPDSAKGRQRYNRSFPCTFALACLRPDSVVPLTLFIHLYTISPLHAG
jgi:hypothetical protein